MYLLLKVIVSALLVAAISEFAKRSTTFGALVASLPLISLLAMIWLYQETRDAARVAALSGEVFWLVLPSLLLFIALPILIRRGMNFYPALAISASCTIVGYALMTLILQRFALKT
jgi:F0F1-type ATP synthase assembly protein I